jgi:hypothetical protein
VPNPALILPQLLELHTDAQHVSIRLAAIEDALRTLIANTTPAEPHFTNARSVGLANAQLVKSGPGRLYGVGGVNTKASAQFILGFDVRGPQPANGTVPDFVMNAPASDSFWASWAPYWRNFEEGWWFCNSSTAASLTIGSNDCWFDVQYL